MTKIISREIRLKSRPVGMPDSGNFETVSVELACPAPGEVLVRNRWLSVDPYMRGRMMDRESYIPPFELGVAMQGTAVGEVIASAHPDFAPGELVMSMNGWREAFVASPEEAFLNKLPQISGLPEQAFLGVMGTTGMTAYFGLELGEPKAGETIFVSGAAGGVGSSVVQIGKIKGCRVIGSAGSDEKCTWLTSLGCDAVINYRTCGDLLAAVREAAPDGIDVYFDNVGGEHLYVALELMNDFGRLVECGMISSYNDAEPPAGPTNMMNIISRNLTMRGFIMSHYLHRHREFLAEMGKWISEGRMKWDETVVEGIENAPGAFLSLFSGGNIGKMLVRVGA